MDLYSSLYHMTMITVHCVIIKVYFVLLHDDPLSLDFE